MMGSWEDGNVPSISMKFGNFLTLSGCFQEGDCAPWTLLHCKCAIGEISN
jgi:hypothetical protein